MEIQENYEIPIPELEPVWPVWEEEDKPYEREEDGRINLSGYFFLLPCQ